MLPPRIVTVVEVADTDSLPLALSEAEREALLRVLYVVKDNFWLDDVEEAMLERLLEPRALAPRSRTVSEQKARARRSSAARLQ
jgi:hypothetical protein